MPVEITIQPNQRIVFIRLSDPTTGIELSKVYDQIEMLRHQYPHQLHCLVDTTDVRGVPSDLFRVRNSVRWDLAANTHNVIVVKNVAFRMLVDTFFRFARFDKAHIVQTVKEGQAFLDKVIEEDARSSS
jgi:hypothetical protein